MKERYNLNTSLFFTVLVFHCVSTADTKFLWGKKKKKKERERERGGGEKSLFIFSSSSSLLMVQQFGSGRSFNGRSMLFL